MASMNERASLTAMEFDALTGRDCGINLTDGHARFPLSGEQAAIIDCIPAMFAEASRRPFSEIEHAAHAAFFNAIGQLSAPVGTGRILSCYSSTLATDIVARAMPADTVIAVLHPTFDNISDLLAARGHSLVPLSESMVRDRRWPVPPTRAIMVAHPNNPTGLIMTEKHLRSLGEHAVRYRQTVIIDASFRGQVRAAQYDTYAVLDAVGADWIFIEDTGKLWPVHELKIGLLAYSGRTDLPIERAFSESLLAVSPVVLQLVTALAADWRVGGYERARRMVERSRAAVRTAIEREGLRLAEPASRISVAQIELPARGPDAVSLYKELLARGVHVLPCARFYWAEPALGSHLIRLSLARPFDVVAAGAQELVRAYRALV
jgi:aspartate/methionine/tyrosine aminotransferase